MMSNRQKFMNLIFDANDKVAWGSNKYFTKAYDPYPEFLHTTAHRFCINPCTYRSGEHVTSVNSLLFEVDEGLTVKEQARLFIESGLPFTSMTYSGSKSIHVIVRFKEAIPYEDNDDGWQKAWWDAIAKSLAKHGIIVDAKTKAVAQLSRVPGSINPKTGKEQKLILLKNRVTQQEVLEWIHSNGQTVETPKQRETNDYVEHSNDNVTDLKKYNIAKKWHVDSKGTYFSSWTTGSHNWFFELGINFWRVDLNPNVGAALAAADFGQTFKGQSDGGWTGYTEDSVQKGYRWAEKQNIKQYTIT